MHEKDLYNTDSTKYTYRSYWAGKEHSRFNVHIFPSLVCSTTPWARNVLLSTCSMWSSCFNIKDTPATCDFSMFSQFPMQTKAATTAKTSIFDNNFQQCLVQLLHVHPQRLGPQLSLHISNVSCILQRHSQWHCSSLWETASFRGKPPTPSKPTPLWMWPRPTKIYSCALRVWHMLHGSLIRSWPSAPQHHKHTQKNQYSIAIHVASVASIGCVCPTNKYKIMQYETVTCSFSAIFSSDVSGFDRADSRL